MYKQVKNIAIVALMTSGIFGTTVFAGDDKEPNLEDNQLKNRVEYKSMKASMSRIDKDQARIDFYKNELKLNRKADRKIEVHMSKKELHKAKADLKRDKAYLRIDKRDLRKDQRLALWEARQAECQARVDLRQAKRELRKDSRKGNLEDQASNLETVKTLTKTLEVKKVKKANLKSDVNDFFDHLDEEIDETLEK